MEVIDSFDAELRALIDGLRGATGDIEPNPSDLSRAAREWLATRIDAQGSFREPGDKLKVFAREDARRGEVAALVSEVVGSQVRAELQGQYPQEVVVREDAERYLLLCGAVVEIDAQLVSRAVLERFLSEHSMTVRDAVFREITLKRANLAQLLEEQVDEIVNEEHRVVASLDKGGITPEILEGHFLQIGPELIKALRASTHNVLSLARLRSDLVTHQRPTEFGVDAPAESVQPLADDLVLFGADMLTHALPRLTAKNPEIVAKTRELVRTDYRRRYQRLAKSLRESDLKTLRGLDRLIDSIQAGMV